MSLDEARIVDSDSDSGDFERMCIPGGKDIVYSRTNGSTFVVRVGKTLVIPSRSESCTFTYVVTGCSTVTVSNNEYASFATQTLKIAPGAIKTLVATDDFRPVGICVIRCIE